MFSFFLNLLVFLTSGGAPQLRLDEHLEFASLQLDVLPARRFFGDAGKYFVSPNRFVLCIFSSLTARFANRKFGFDLSTFLDSPFKVSCLRGDFF